MTYTFDIAWDCPVQDFLSFLERYDLKLESWTTCGPGGGNPEITVSGTPETIAKLQAELQMEGY